MTNYLVFSYTSFPKIILKGYLVFVKISEPDLLAAVGQVERGDGAVEHLEGEDATLLCGRGVVCEQGCQMAKFDAFLSLDCTGWRAGKEGIKFCSVPEP